MKVLINSYPRSGTTTFVDAIRMATISNEVQFGEDFFHHKNWISKSHIPVLFFATFPKDIVIATILRDPVDAISSNCFRWANGHTGNIVQGKIVIDKSRETKENKFDDILKSLIEHQVKQYISYYSCLSQNLDNILLFHYDEIQNDIKSSIDKIVNATGEEFNNLNYESANKILKNPPQPTKEKTRLYYDIRDYVSSLKDTDECYRLYNNIVEIKDKK